jgi:hypothetical protein
MRQHPGEEGVSEVVGVMLLIGVTVLAVAIVAAVFLSGPQPGEIPHATIVAGNKSGSLVLAHEGGDPLREGEYRIYVDTGSGLMDGTRNFTEPEGGIWSIGGTLAYNGTGTPERVVVTAVSGGSETILAEPEFRGGGAGFSPDPVEPGTVTNGGGSEEMMPVSIVAPIAGTTMKFDKNGKCDSSVSANVTNVSVTRVDFIMYDCTIPHAFVALQENATWVPGNGTYESKFEVQYGKIKDVTSVVIAAIAFNETDIVGCDAQKMSITVVK